MSRPTEPFTAAPNLPPGIGALMARASAKQWLVVLSDGRKFYQLTEDRARRFAANTLRDAGLSSTIYPPEA